MSGSCPHIRGGSGYVGKPDPEVVDLKSGVAKKCQVCLRQPWNIWLCLYPGCYMLGCSDDEEGSPDHSTRHFEANPQHLVQLNIRTRKIWCYGCIKEVTADLPEFSAPKGQPVSVEEQEAVEKRRKKFYGDSTPGGVVGLINLGNTCYLNAALQCLSNIPALTDFFLTCGGLVENAFTGNSSSSKKSLSLSYLNHVRAIWSAPDSGDLHLGQSKYERNRHVAPTKLISAFKYNHPMFRGFQQQDSQEFLKYFLDQLHEELMEPVPDFQEVEEVEGQEETLTIESPDLGPDEDDQDQEEYETADSGVSEQSSGSFESRKRKPDEASSGVSSLNDQVQKRQRSVSLSGGKLNLIPGKLHKRKPKTYKSVISDIFDGKLVSTVQCLTCNRVSTTTETFQDLSLPIPTQDSIQNSSARNQKLIQATSSTPTPPGSPSSSTSSLASSQGNVDQLGTQGGWLSWMWSWVSDWFYGPNITLHDCLAYFFSADELKGDNMYSCEKCKKLRNGLKYSRVTVLPDTLCIHLKRFRHDFSFSTKISSKVTFPLVDLDMSPWLHQDCISKEAMYDLTGIVCHHGTAGGGHYTAYALNPANEEWYEFDDSFVTRVDPNVVLSSEAYVLFYRKNNCLIENVRGEVQELLRQDHDVPSLVQYYISRQWLNKLENFAEPGPIDNSDFLCRHGGVLPTKEAQVGDLCAEFPRSVWELLHQEFGSVRLGPTAPAGCTRLHPCTVCKAELESLVNQKSFELEEFKRLHQEFQMSDNQGVFYCMASSWFKQWEAFVTGRARDPPGEIDNRGIIESVTNRHQVTGNPVTFQVLRHNSDHLRVSQSIWNLFRSIYGGGPEVILRRNGMSIVIPTDDPATSACAASGSGDGKCLRTRTASESSPR